MNAHTKALGKLVNAARGWERARAHLRQVRDSRRAKEPDIKKAELLVVKATVLLEKSVLEFNQAMPFPVRTGKSVDWGKVLGVISHLAGSVERAVGPSVEIIDAEIIDTDGQSS